MILQAALFLIPVLSLVGVLAYSMPILLGLVRGCRAEDITAEWVENFSVSTYSVMEGLLDERDFDFLSRQSGFDLSLYRKLRRERLSIFSQYLKRLVLDFNRLYFSARVLIAHMPEDQSKAFEGLLMLKVRFSMRVLKTQASYLLCLVGLQTLEVRSLLQNLEEMNGHFLQLAADQSPA
jgi:hypothetical protein